MQCCCSPAKVEALVDGQRARCAILGCHQWRKARPGCKWGYPYSTLMASCCCVPCTWRPSKAFRVSCSYAHNASQHGLAVTACYDHHSIVTQVLYCCNIAFWTLAGPSHWACTKPITQPQQNAQLIWLVWVTQPWSQWRPYAGVDTTLCCDCSGHCGGTSSHNCKTKREAQRGWWQRHHSGNQRASFWQAGTQQLARMACTVRTTNWRIRRCAQYDF